MSVLSYLNTLSSSLVISEIEKTGIRTSISSLENHLRLWGHSIDIVESFTFGSFDRGTILPRWADPSSDIDYMLVFRNPNSYQPQTFLNWLRDFAQSKYPRSYNQQSFPTVVLELNHIRFELVPAIKPWGYMIPTKEAYYGSWQNTDPLTLKQKVVSANVINGNVRPLIRIMKYWNAQKGKVFPSFELETIIATRLYWQYSNLEECFYSLVDSLPVRYEYPQYKKNVINNLKYKVRLVQSYQREGKYLMAENILKSIFE